MQEPPEDLLTIAEAAQQVTGGATRAADLGLRVVEGMGGLREFMAQRPQQVDLLGRQAIEQVAEAPASPSMIGPAVQKAAQRIVSDRQAAINAEVRPLYEQAEQVRLGVAASELARDPIYSQALAEVRSDPALNATIAHLPDD